MNMQLIRLISFLMLLTAGVVEAGGVNAKVGGDFESKVSIKTAVQAGLGLSMKQNMSVGSVECAEVAGDHRTNVKQDSLIQAGVGLWTTQKMSIGAIRGAGCNP